MHKQKQGIAPKPVHIHVDPLNEFTHISGKKLLEACGFLPGWVVADKFLHLPLQEALDKQYCCGLFPMEGEITKEGIFTYPGDPDLHPFLKINRGDEIFYQYRNAIVGIVNEKGEVYITRMD